MAIPLKGYVWVIDKTKTVKDGEDVMHNQLAVIQLSGASCHKTVASGVEQNGI